MPLPDLHRALLPYNTHWQTGRASLLVRKHPTARRSFRHIRDRIHDLPFEVLAGPRQVGKTTLVGNLIDHLLQQGIPPERILFVPCDLPVITLETQGQTQPFIDLFQERILRTTLDSLDSPAYLFLDEVHELDDWSRQLKALYDTYHPWLRVFATGSSSVSLLDPPTADLPGRVRTSYIFPLKFNEAVEALVTPLSSIEHEAYLHAREARDAFRHALDDEGRRRLRDALDRLHATLLPFDTALKDTFNRYLTRGGFPAALLASDDAEATLFHEQTLDLAISRDLEQYTRVRKTHAFRGFLAQMARQHGGRFVPNQVASALGLDRGTTVQWKEIAEEMFLIQRLPAMNERFNPLPARQDKAYIVDPGLRAYLSTERTLENLETSGRIGHIVEGVVHDHVRRLQSNLLTSRSARIGYLPRPELDIVAEIPGGWLAIEVKYTDRPEEAARTLERRSLPKENVLRIVLARDTYHPTDPVWILPLWMFCFIC